jgi:hypothetical protein
MLETVQPSVRSEGITLGGFELKLPPSVLER